VAEQIQLQIKEILPTIKTKKKPKNNKTSTLADGLHTAALSFPYIIRNTYRKAPQIKNITY